MQVAVCIVSAHNEVYQQKMRYFDEGVGEESSIVDWTTLPSNHKDYIPVIYGSVKKREPRHITESSRKYLIMHDLL